MCDTCIHKIVCSKYIATGGVNSCEHYMNNWQADVMEALPNLVQAMMAVIPDVVDAVVENVSKEICADMRGKEDG